MTAARQRVGYTPAASRILLRRRVRYLLGKQPVPALLTRGGTMNSTTAPGATSIEKRGWTPFELFMLAPFGILLWYVATEPLVLPVAPVHAAAPVQADVAAVAVPVVDPDAPVFVTAGTTVLQRIAPVARVTLEAQEAAPVPQESAQAQVPAAPAVAVAQPPAPAVEAPVQQAAATARIEIIDGTGVDGLASGLAAQLEKAGVKVSGTGTMVAGSQRRTVILYRDGFEDEAVRLSKLFVRPPALVNNTRSRNAADTSEIRLVLGSAASREKNLLASGT